MSYPQQGITSRIMISIQTKLVKQQLLTFLFDQLDGAKDYIEGGNSLVKSVDSKEEYYDMINTPLMDDMINTPVMDDMINTPVVEDMINTPVMDDMINTPVMDDIQEGPKNDV